MRGFLVVQWCCGTSIYWCLVLFGLRDDVIGMMVLASRWCCLYGGANGDTWHDYGWGLRMWSAEEEEEANKNSISLYIIQQIVFPLFSKGVQKEENSITLYKYITGLCFRFVFAPLHAPFHKHWKHDSIIQQLYKRNRVSMKTIFRKEKKSVNSLIWTGNNDNETNNNSFMYY